MTPTQTYPIYEGAFWLFRNYSSRAVYLAATGNQAPPFDPTRAPQYWEDPAQVGKTGTVTYDWLDAADAAAGYVGTMTMPCADAAHVNLPGTYNYPAYVSQPTDAVEAGVYGVVGLVAANIVCLEADAQTLANTLAPLFPGLTPTVTQGATGVFYYIYGLDPRRVWYVTIGNQSYIAQELIEAQNSAGVGYPGSFTQKNGAINWVRGTPVIQPTGAAESVSVPMRPLLPGEQIVTYSVMPGSMGFMIIDLPLRIAAAQAAAAAALAALEAQA